MFFFFLQKLQKFFEFKNCHNKSLSIVKSCHYKHQVHSTDENKDTYPRKGPNLALSQL